MQRTTVRSWSATLVGVFFVLVTGWGLMEDVLRHAAADGKSWIGALVNLEAALEPFTRKEKASADPR